MGIFWCISITYNVNSYKKINEKAQTAKFTVFAREISSAVLKSGKLGKLKCKLLKIFKYYTISRGHHEKADVPRFPKMWYFLSVAVFKGELLAVKVNSNFKQKKWVRGGVTKKSHGHNFDFSGLARNQRLTIRVGSTLIPCRVRKIKIVAVTFFLNAS